MGRLSSFHLAHDFQCLVAWMDFRKNSGLKQLFLMYPQTQAGVHAHARACVIDACPARMHVAIGKAGTRRGRLVAGGPRML